MIHLITELIAVEPYKLTLKFNTGEIRQVDLEAKLNEWATDPKSKFAELKALEYFKSVKLDPDFNSLVWENGIDLCPDVVYDLSSEANRKSVA
jgi:hypothetical protein